MSRSSHAGRFPAASNSSCLIHLKIETLVTLHAHRYRHSLRLLMRGRRYYDDAMMQAEAQGWADAFNKRRPPKEVQFLTGLIPCICVLSPTAASQHASLTQSPPLCRAQPSFAS